jgi:serine protease Do
MLARGLLLSLLLLLAAPSGLRAQDLSDSDRGPTAVNEFQDAFGLDRLFVPRWRLTDGPQVHRAFRDVIQLARQATVSVQCGGKHVSLGGIVRSDGWLITKATPLCGKPTVVLSNGRTFDAVNVGVDGKHDLALLKVDSRDLPALDLSTKEAPPVGSWLATVGRSQDPIAVGVVSVLPREIPPQPGVLGVELDMELPLVVRVFPESAAQAAGVKAHDRIIKVAGKNTPTRAKLKEIVAAFNPGDEIDFTIDREGKQLVLKAKLGGDFPGLMDRHDFQNSLGGQLSVRRFGFPLAFQHDTVLEPEDCGGPVVDVDGKVVGFNISRAGRTESYALPVSEVQLVFSKLLGAKMSVSKDAAAAQSTPSIAPANLSQGDR